jgi:hexosaminidase
VPPLVLWMTAARAVAFESLLPAPRAVQPAPGRCSLPPAASGIAADPVAASGVDLLRSRLRGRGHRVGAVFTTEGADADLGPEGYILEISPAGVIARASHRAGFIHAAYTLLQLAPEGPDEAIPCGRIVDAPEHSWRGLMLDSARRHYAVPWIETLVEQMARHKLNVLHWHLTDDEGWRLAIEAYPRLAEVGGRRGPGTSLPHDQIPGVRAADRGQVHEGTYSRGDVRRIVDFARARGVTVVPEIDVPGHAKAAITAYPELLQDPADPGDYRSAQRVRHNAVDPGLDSTYAVLDAVIAEVVGLFPDSPYVHLGGDEVPPGAWTGSPAAQRRAGRLGLGSVRDLHGVFFQRMEAMVAARGRRLMGWQEVATGPGPPRRPGGAIIAWSDVPAALEAARSQGLAVVLAPASHLYFDARYVDVPGEPGHTWAGATDAREVYAYRPPDAGDVEVLGLEACLWSERIADEAEAERMLWPRTAAFAEVAWSPPEGRSWAAFEPRIRRHLVRLEAQGVRSRRLDP